jgi:hypothetical protein
MIFAFSAISTELGTMRPSGESVLPDTAADTQLDILDHLPHDSSAE